MFWPDILPGARYAVVNVNDGGPRLDLLDLRSGERRVLLDGNFVARYAAPGHLLIQRGDQSVSAVPFDARSGTITGSPVALLPSVARGVAGSADLDVSRNGVLAFVAAGTFRRTIVIVDRTGRERPLITKPEAYDDARLSPDGRSLAFDQATGDNRDIWVYDLARATSVRLTSEPDNFFPTWRPDGKRIVFASRRAGPADVYSVAGDGSGPIDTVLRSASLSFPGTFTPDGRTLLFRQTNGTSGFDILSVQPDDPARTARPVLQSRFNESAPALSPDGRWLAYVSDETGRNEVYLRHYPLGEGRWAVSMDGGSEPVWRRDGRELFFRTGNGVYAVTVDPDAGAAPRIGQVTLLFSGPYARTERWADYGVMPGGREFVMVRNGASAAQLQVAINSTSLLAARAAPASER